MNINKYNAEYLKRRIIYKYGITQSNLIYLAQGDIIFAYKANDFNQYREKCLLCNYNSAYIIINNHRLKCIRCKHIIYFEFLSSNHMYMFVDLCEIPNIVI